MPNCPPVIVTGRSLKVTSDIEIALRSQLEFSDRRCALLLDWKNKWQDRALKAEKELASTKQADFHQAMATQSQQIGEASANLKAQVKNLWG